MEAPGRKERPARWLSAQWQSVPEAWVSSGQMPAESWVALSKWGQSRLSSFGLRSNHVNLQANKFSIFSYITGINSA